MSSPTHPVELLACAIATQEGFFALGSMPAARRNPGDLRYAGQIGASCGRCGEKGGIVSRRCVTTGGASFDTHDIASFQSVGLGTTALFRQLWLQVAEGQTVRQIIAQWAPPTENNTSVYLQNILHWTGLAADTPVLQLLSPLVALNGDPT